MKTITELRTVLKFQPQEINSFLKYMKSQDIDFDVYLPTLKMNLQRGLVWNVEQKRELIWSILMRRNIPRMAMIYTCDNIYQVIDGKQRLSSMLEFLNNEFDLIIDGKSYLFCELPKDYKNCIEGYCFPYYIVNEDYGRKISDKEKINWFKFINFAGTPQDKKHFENLNK